MNRYNSEVNGYFLCDRGRFGYEFVNSSDREKQVRINGESASPVTALAQARQAIASRPTIGIGSPRASLEANFALRELVGSDNFYSGASQTDFAIAESVRKALEGSVPSASLSDVEDSDAVFIVGEDATNTAPILALRLRQSVRQRASRLAHKLGIPLWLDQAVREAAQEERSPLYIAAPYATKLDDIAADTWHAVPSEIIRLALAVAHEIDANSPQIDGLPDIASSLAKQIAHNLVTAERPLVVSGYGLQSSAIIDASAQIAYVLKARGCDVRLALTLPEANSLGTSLLHPGSFEQALDAARHGRVKAVIVLENDLYRRAPRRVIDAFLANAGTVIVLDHIRTETTEASGIFFPCSSYAESDGTLVSNEGRAQRFFEVVPPPDTVQASWRWLRDLAAPIETSGHRWETLDDVIEAVGNEFQSLAPIRHAAPLHAKGKIPREPNRYSGRTSMLANISVHEPKPPEDPDSSLAFSMETSPQASESPAMIPFFWAPGWNSIQATAKFQAEVGGHLRGGDPGVRLLDPRTNAVRQIAIDVPGAFEPRAQGLLPVPMFHIFGSEELSVRAPAIRQLIPSPRAAINPADAQTLSLSEGDSIKLQSEAETIELPVVLRNDIPLGVVCVPAGITSASTRTAPVTLPETTAASSLRGSL